MRCDFTRRTERSFHEEYRPGACEGDLESFFFGACALLALVQTAALLELSPGCWWAEAFDGEVG